MSLQPNAIELCQASSLRERRRSSIRPQTLLPLLFASGGPPPNQNESAVADDASLPEYPSTDVSPTPTHLISPISNAHVSGHSSNFSTSRHHDAFSIHKSDLAVSPSDTAVSGDSYFEPEIAPKKDSRVKWRLASTIFLYFLNGWGDGVTGTALPYFRADFHLSYMISSLLFVGTMCGFSLGTLLVPRIVNFLGRFPLSETKIAWLPMSPWRIAHARSSSDTLGHSPSKARYLVLIIFSFCPPVSFIMMGSKQGFPTMFMSYIVVAFGRAVLTASLNVFLSERRSKCLGYAFGVWSLGAVASPLIFQLTAAAGLPWTHFYFGSLVIAAVNYTFLAITFFPTTHEFAVDRKRAMAEVDSRTRRSPIRKFDGDDALDSSATLSQIPSPPNPLRLVSTMPYHWAIALFSMLYCGSETTTQGLIVQYLLAERSANPKTVGYVSSGFWAGETVARVAWSYFSPRISFTGRKYIIQCSLGLALGMQILIWLVHSDLENVVSASLIGLFFGPIFPACLELATDLLPPEVTMISMAIISATGSLGSAVFPFITGVVTTKYTMRVWSYITVAQVAIMFGTWWLFPTRQPPRRAVAL